MSSPTGPAADVRENARLDALARYGVMDTAPEATFDDLVQLAAHVCGTPSALISLVDDRRQWFKAQVGPDVVEPETERDVAFCAHALTRTTVLEVPDARADARFRDNPMVTGEPFIRFYAGSPLITPDGWVLGTLCAIDSVPRRLTGGQRAMLSSLARQVVAQLELRRQAHALADEVAEHEVARDELRTRTAALAASEERFRAAFASAPVGMALLDADGGWSQVNAALSALVRRPVADLLADTSPTSILHPQDRAAFRVQHDSALAHPGTARHVELRLRAAGDDEVWGAMSLTALPTIPGWPAGDVLLQVQDVTERRAATEELERRALRDPVTGLPNRVALLDRARRALSVLRCEPERGRLGVFFVDLDDFKAVNDSFGHATGDAVLVAVGSALGEVVRTTDTVARLGGDEFVVLAEFVHSEAEAAAFAERLRVAVAAARPAPGPGIAVSAYVRASIGTALGTGADDVPLGPELLLQRADAAMYAIKPRRVRAV